MTNTQPGQAGKARKNYWQRVDCSPTEMNGGRSVAIMEPSEYCRVGGAKWNVLPAVGEVCVLAVGSHATEHWLGMNVV